MQRLTIFEIAPSYSTCVFLMQNGPKATQTGKNLFKGTAVVFELMTLYILESSVCGRFIFPRCVAMNRLKNLSHYSFNRTLLPIFFSIKGRFTYEYSQKTARFTMSLMSIQIIIKNFGERERRIW